MVIYYSGTGNSRKLAQVLAAQLHDEAYDITADLREKQFPAFQNKAAAYVFVCPAYAYRIPRIFENYLRQARFEGGKNAYFVLSCGSNIGNAMHHTKTVCRQIGLHFQGIAAVKMPENYICMFDSPPQDTARKLVLAGEETVRQLADTIRAGKPLPAVRGSSFLTYVVNPVFYKLFVHDKKFYATDACTGCGLCTKVCPLKNITLENGRPSWHGNCTQCQACISICPHTAIEYGKITLGKRRHYLK